MLGLPKSTEMNKQLPKKAIYAKFQMTAAARGRIDASISKITIVNEITPDRVNIPAGEEVKGFFILLVALRSKGYDEKTIGTLSKLIPQNILFVLEYEGQSRLAIYRTKLIQSEWKPTDEQRIELRRLDLDRAWENVVKGVAFDSEELGVWNEELSLDENLVLHEKQAKLEREIARLEKLARAEKQPKKKFELVQTLSKLRKELSE